MHSKEVILLKKALDRQKKARKQAEQILEKKSKELYETLKQLKDTNRILENLLEDDNAQMGNVFVNLIDPYVVMDLEGKIIKINHAAEEFLGYTKEDNITMSALVHPDYKEYTLQSFKSLYSTGLIKRYRPKIYTKNKGIKHIEINGSLITDRSGKPVAAQGVFRDITYESEMKSLLNQQRQRLDIIVENSPIGILLSVEGKLLKSNKTIQDMLGYSETELMALRMQDFMLIDSLKNTQKYSEQLQKGTLNNFSVINKYVKKNGSCFTAKTTVNAVHNNFKKLEYEVALIEDITNELELEEEKKQLLKDLESSNKGLQEYAHIVSHDLKSPLRSISALSTWLYEDYKDKLDDDGIFNLKMMQEKVASMDKLIDGILKYSTINKDTLETGVVDVNEVVKEITAVIYIPTHVSVKITNPLPIIFADRTKIYQLFQNFLSNAVVNIEKEKGLVQIGSVERENFWEFSIQDNGIGIPKAYHEKIFKIFQSIGNKERSTGIGLSIVKKIIDLYEGKVWLKSAQGKGTTFYFTLKK